MHPLLKKILDPPLKSRCQFASQVEGKFETHFLQIVVSVGGPEQGDQCCFGAGLYVDYVCDTGYLMNKLIYPSVSLIFLSSIFVFIILSFMIGFLYQEGFLYSGRTRGGAWENPSFLDQTQACMVSMDIS